VWLRENSVRGGESSRLRHAEVNPVGVSTKGGRKGTTSSWEKITGHGIRNRTCAAKPEKAIQKKRAVGNKKMSLEAGMLTSRFGGGKMSVLASRAIGEEKGGTPAAWGKIKNKNGKRDYFSEGGFKNSNTTKSKGDWVRSGKKKQGEVTMDLAGMTTKRHETTGGRKKTTNHRAEGEKRKVQVVFLQKILATRGGRLRKPRGSKPKGGTTKSREGTDCLGVRQ